MRGWRCKGSKAPRLSQRALGCQVRSSSQLEIFKSLSIEADPSTSRESRLLVTTESYLDETSPAPTAEEVANQIVNAMGTIQSSNTNSTNTDHPNAIEGPFVSKPANWTTLPGDQSRSIEIVIRNTIDPNLLDIIDSRKIQSPQELCELLTQKCQPMDRRRKLNFVENFVALMKRKTSVSEQWIVDWHKIYSELNQLNISRDELIGLLFQASLNLPDGIDPVTFDFLANQRLENHPNPSFDKVSTVLSTTLFDLRVKDESNSKGRREGSMCDYCQDEVWDRMEPEKDNTTDEDDSNKSDADYVPPNRPKAADKADHPIAQVV
ncbi:hypothetical protein PtB15_16B117 [Puccinia triticina]|nr:hypothetical protein PtB15_16B117 [Puccinia triticina]